MVIKVAANNFDTENFGIYNIGRRAISLVSFPLLLCLGISIPRYISINYKDINKHSNY